jgi:hypothetical protein
MMMIVMAFIVGGVVLAFVVMGTDKAESQAGNRVQINNLETLNQLIMYNSLIAHVCDDSVAAGALDNSGSRMYDSWMSYKKVWKMASTNTDDGLFSDLNRSYPRPDLNCYGTGTTFGSLSIGNKVDPTSKEWRNDQEGKFSRIKFVVNDTAKDGWFQGSGTDYGHAGGGAHVQNSGPGHDGAGEQELWTTPCFWFDQTYDSQKYIARDSAGEGKYGITDAAFVHIKPHTLNIYARFIGEKKGNPSGGGGMKGCPEPWAQRTGGSGTKSDELEGGPLVTVTWIPPQSQRSQFMSNNFGDQFTSKSFQPNWEEPGEGHQCRGLGACLHTCDEGTINFGPDSGLSITSSGASDCDYLGANDMEVKIRYYPVKLCEGMTGYIQTNTGFTVNQAGEWKEEDPPAYDMGNFPGFGNKEHWWEENAAPDNSLHTFIVITDMGKCG